MQLKHNAYSKNGLSTMIPVNDSIPKEVLGQFTYPSQQDYLDIMLTFCGEKDVLSNCYLLRVNSIEFAFMNLIYLMF